MGLAQFWLGVDRSIIDNNVDDGVGVVIVIHLTFSWFSFSIVSIFRFKMMLAMMFNIWIMIIIIDYRLICFCGQNRFRLLSKLINNLCLFVWIGQFRLFLNWNIMFHLSFAIYSHICFCFSNLNKLNLKQNATFFKCESVVDIVWKKKKTLTSSYDLRRKMISNRIRLNEWK